LTQRDGEAPEPRLAVAVADLAVVVVAQ